MKAELMMSERGSEEADELKRLSDPEEPKEVEKLLDEVWLEKDDAEDVCNDDRELEEGPDESNAVEEELVAERNDDEDGADRWDEDVELDAFLGLKYPLLPFADCWWTSWKLNSSSSDICGFL